ncbi:MAG: DMT family transporter [Myxococcales bacterium]|nr:DMT family transporter [Myxococcales bacterium]
MGGASPVTRRASGTAMIAFSSVLFAGMAVLVRTLRGEIAAGQLVVMRMAIGLAGMGLLLAALRRRPAIPRMVPWAARGVLGGVAVYCYFFAIEELGVGPATLLNYASPCYAALFAVLFLRERPSAHLWGGLLLATAGAFVVAWSTAAPDRPFALGLGAWAGMASAMLGGAAITTIKSLREDTDAPTVFLSFSIFGLLVSIPMGLADWRALEHGALLRALAVAVLALLAQLLYTHAMAFVSTAAGAATTQLVPVLTWAMAVSLLGEELGPVTLLGSIACVAGVVWGVTHGSAGDESERASGGMRGS